MNSGQLCLVPVTNSSNSSIPQARSRTQPSTTLRTTATQPQYKENEERKRPTCHLPTGRERSAFDQNIGTVWRANVRDENVTRNDQINR